MAAGLVSGVLIGWFRRVRYWGMPILKVVGPIPATAYVPLVMALFPNAFVSGQRADRAGGLVPGDDAHELRASPTSRVSYLDVARTLGAGRRYLIFRVAIPAAMPSIFLGLFMGLGASFLTLIVAETVGVRSGLGWYLKWQQGYVEYAKVYAALVIMAVVLLGPDDAAVQGARPRARLAEGRDPMVTRRRCRYRRRRPARPAAEGSSLAIRDVSKVFRAADGGESSARWTASRCRSRRARWSR